MCERERERERMREVEGDRQNMKEGGVSRGSISFVS